MKINPITSSAMLRSYQTSKPLAPQKQKAASSGDEVSFSEEALSFSKVMSEAKEKAQPGYRSPEESSRIEEITAAVRQGNYRVDSDKIAESIINTIIGG